MSGRIVQELDRMSDVLNEQADHLHTSHAPMGRGNIREVYEKYPKVLYLATDRAYHKLGTSLTSALGNFTGSLAREFWGPKFEDEFPKGNASPITMAMIETAGRSIQQRLESTADANAALQSVYTVTALATIYQRVVVPWAKQHQWNAPPFSQADLDTLVDESDKKFWDNPTEEDFRGLQDAMIIGYWTFTPEYTYPYVPGNP